MLRLIFAIFGGLCWIAVIVMLIAIFVYLVAPMSLDKVGGALLFVAACIVLSVLLAKAGGM